MWSIIESVIVAVIVSAAVVIVAVKAVRAWRRRNNPGCSCGCSSCPISHKCDIPKRNNGANDKK